MATRKGDDKNNRLTGTAGDDLIFGYGGDDVIVGGKGNDQLSGGSGGDTFVFGPKDIGQDTVTDFGKGDRIDLSAFGISSFAVLKAYYLKPFNFGTSFGFRSNGQAVSIFLQDVDPNTLKAADFILSTSKKPVITKGTAGDDDLFGGGGDDRIGGGAGSDRMSGGAGKDVFAFDKRLFSQDFILDFEKGDRIDLTGLGVSDFAQLKPFLHVNGTDSKPGFRITTSYGNAEESIFVDTVGFRQPAATDFVFDTSVKADTVRGTAGNDVLFGGRGASTIIGGDGADYLLGGAGNDVLNGGGGGDTFVLGEGKDRAVFSERFFGGARIVDFEKGDRIDLSGVGVGDFSAIAPFLRQTDTKETVLFLGVGAAITLDGVKANALTAADFVFQANGKARTVNGGDFDDFLIGGVGDDRLNGGGGYDTLTAGAGRDTINGGANPDLMYGGAGADTFLYASTADAQPSSAIGNIDRIGDFSRKDGDRIDLSRIDANEATRANDAFTFIGTRAFSGAAGEVRYEISDGAAHVFVCTEAGAAQPYQMEFLLSGMTDLKATDFIL